jgi:hypothetical protein
MTSGNYGILGPFKGTVGPVTGYLRNGKNVLRSSNSLVKDKVTPGRAAQREKMRICNKFSTAFTGKGFFNKTFPAYGHTGTGFNRVTGALMSRALTGAYPDLKLDYAEVLISKGRLPGAKNIQVLKKANSTLQFTFADNSMDGIASPNDTVILAAYAPDLQYAVFTLHGGFRKDSKAVLNVAAFKGHTVETWIGFLSADEQDASDSAYAGRVML